MRPHRMVIGGIALLLAAGCNSGDSSGSDTNQDGDTSIGSDEVNRFALQISGGITLDHTGGLICSVEDGEMVMDFSIDASDGDYEYGIVAGFEPAAAELIGSFDMIASGTAPMSGEVSLTYGYGPAPDGYEGVVRAAGTVSGSLPTDSGEANVTGSYACFLMDSEVGN